MMRDERLGRGAAGDGLHHRRLHFQEAFGFEKLANRRDDGAAFLETLQHVGIGPQIDVSLPVPLVHIRQAVEFLRRRQQAFTQESHTVGPYGDFAGLGPAQLSGGADDIAKFQQFCQFPLLAQQFLAQTDLNRPAAVAQRDKNQLADIP